MASFNQLFDLRCNCELRNKIVSAIMCKISALFDKQELLAVEREWLNKAMADPMTMADHLLNYYLGACQSGSIEDIKNEPDGNIYQIISWGIDAIIYGDHSFSTEPKPEPMR